MKQKLLLTGAVILLTGAVTLNFFLTDAIVAYGAWIGIAQDIGLLVSAGLLFHLLIATKIKLGIEFFKILLV